MNKLLKSAWLLAIAAAGLAFSVTASASSDVKPQWVRRGEEMMNKKRKSENYEFKVFHSFDADLSKLKDERFLPLLEYIGLRHAVDPLTLQLDSLVSSDSAPVTYRVSFGENDANVVYAQLVDEYQSFEDYVDNAYGFEFYQLYAITGLNAFPVFDTFEVQECDNTKATLLSLIPRAGQFYKGSTGKAAAILAGEAFFGTGVFVFQEKMKLADAHYKNGDVPNDSWYSKARSAENLRNICIVSMVGIYLYGLLDAAIPEGSSRVKVTAPKGQEITLGPAPNGFGLTYSF